MEVGRQGENSRSSALVIVMNKLITQRKAAFVVPRLVPPCSRLGPLCAGSAY